MAKVLGPRTRGRRKEQLRITAAELAATVTSAKGDKTVTVELLPGEGKRKGESVEVTVPKGAAIVPFSLTSVKEDANAREQIRLGARDADADVAIKSHSIELDSGDVLPLFYMAAK